MSFLVEYLRHPLLIGAVAPSSHFLARKMLRASDIAACRCIVEYGPGTGSFTEEIARQKRPEVPLIAIEQDRAFYEELRERFMGDPSVHIVHGSARDVRAALESFGIDGTDLVISGLPFASLPHTVSEEILEATAEVLGEDGRFITFQYTLFKRRLFEKRFRIVKTLFELRNLPAAFILVMKRKG